MRSGKGRRQVADSIRFLMTNRTDLEGFEDIEDFIFASGPSNQRYRDAFEHHFIVVRQAIATLLWSREMFVGASVLDALLFRAVAHTLTDNPVRWVLEYVRDQGLHGRGLVVYPVHSFGLLGAGLFSWMKKAEVAFVRNEFELALSPQTNDWEKSWKFVNELRGPFGISRTLPRELVEHWSRSRPIRWLTLNPLLAVACSSFPGEYYENQSLLIVRLQFATSLCFMLASLQPNDGDRASAIKGLSSSISNNFQTLDIRHYLVFYPDLSDSRKLTGQCVPIQRRRAALTDLSDLSIELNPRYWRRVRRLAYDVYGAITKIRTGFLHHSLGSGNQNVAARVYRKIFDALVYYRRSFRPEHPDESAVHLATAFETLLTDYYPKGGRVEKLLGERLRLAARGIRGLRKMTAAVEELYDARSKVVHQGRHDLKADLFLARRAFTHALIGVASRLDRVQHASTAHPIEDILR